MNGGKGKGINLYGPPCQWRFDDTQKCRRTATYPGCLFDEGDAPIFSPPAQHNESPMGRKHRCKIPINECMAIGRGDQSGTPRAPRRPLQRGLGGRASLEEGDGVGGIHPLQ